MLLVRICPEYFNSYCNSGSDDHRYRPYYDRDYDRYKDHDRYSDRDKHDDRDHSDRDRSRHEDGSKMSHTKPSGATAAQADLTAAPV